jgi:hypothetical protein
MLRDRGKTAGGAASFGGAATPKRLAWSSREKPEVAVFHAGRHANRRQMGMPMPVSFTELSDAVDFVSAGHNEENRAYLRKESGKIYCHSDFVPDLDELPEDIEDEEKYLRIPDQRNLDLGKPLMLDFAGEYLPDDVDTVRDISARGAPTPNSRLWWPEEGFSIVGTISG